MTTPVPSVPDFLAGFGPQQSDMQSLWVNAAAFFQQRVIFRASQTSGATSLPASGAMTTVAFNNIIEDPYSGWNASTHKWTPPAGYGGWYQVTTTIFTQAPSAFFVGLEVQVTAAGIASGALVCIIVPPSGIGGAEATYYCYLTAGQDAVSVQAAIQNSSAAISTNATATSGQAPTLELCWLSS